MDLMIKSVYYHANFMVYHREQVNEIQSIYAKERFGSLSHPVPGGDIRFSFLRGTGGGVLWWTLPIERPDVGEVKEEVRGYMWVCCGVLFHGRRSSVLDFFGEKTVLVVVCGRYPVSSDAGHLVGCMGRSVGMLL